MARFRDVVFDCCHAPSLARFWAATLEGYAVAPYGPDEDPETDTNVLVESQAGLPRLWFQQVPEVRVAKNRVHLDVQCDDTAAEVQRLVTLGATVIATRPNLPHGLVSMRDPEGNEFCVVEGAEGRARFTLGTAVYAVRADGDILLVQRAAGTALGGQFFLPGGKVEANELPADGARRELFEETGLSVRELSMVGCYPMRVNGKRSLQLTYWGTVVDDSVTLSKEHTASQWVDPSDIALLTPDVMSAVAAGREDALAVLRHMRADRDEFLKLRRHRGELADPI